MNYNQTEAITTYEYSGGLLATSTKITTYPGFDLIYLIVKFSIPIIIIVLLFKKKR